MESNLPTKLQQFSADPPGEVWDKIADSLDSDKSFSRRLFHYAEEPPAAAWQAIAKDLAEPVEADVVPFFKRFRKPLRYAVVASFIAVVLVTVTLTVKRTEAGALEAGSKTTVPEQVSSKQQDRVPQALTQQVTKEDKDATQKQDESTTEEANNTTASTRKDSLRPQNTNATLSSMNAYVFFTDGDGIMRKVPKKLASLVKCKDDDIVCQQRLQDLRQRMAAKAMTTDFTGILEMLHQLQQKP